MTIKDIAKKAGVSVATVSRVLNNYKWVSDDVRTQVLKVIEKENYRPNYGASMMASGKSKIILVIVPDIRSPYFAQFTGRVTQSLKKAGYATMLCQTNNDAKEELDLFNSPLPRMADGVISVTDGLEEEDVEKALIALKEKNKPILFVDRYIHSSIADCVINNNTGGMRKAVEYLFERGHRKIGLILGSTGITIVHDKLRGFRATMRELHLPIREEFIRSGEWTVQTGYNETAKLLRMPSPPTAIIACNNYICEGVVKRLQQSNIKIGTDISVIGMEESDSDARLFDYLGITTLRLECNKIADYASSFIVNNLRREEKQSFYSATEFQIELIERSSVKRI